MQKPEPLEGASQPELIALREALSGDHPDLPQFEAMLARLVEANLLEQALLDLKRAHPRRGMDAWAPIRARLEAEVGRARIRRMNRWQLDPQRRTLRILMAVRSPACNLHPPALQAALSQALVQAGLPLAMGLEKTPRPMVRLGHPLPTGVEGLGEWADVVLREPLTIPLERLTDQVNSFCSEGLRLLAVSGIPNHSSSVLDLCKEALWMWACPQDLFTFAKARLDGFAEADSYEIEKSGKVDGQKQMKKVEVRHVVTGMTWLGESLQLTTRLSAGDALNPIKLLAGILGLDPSAITGLSRVRVELAEDPRLLVSEKYEPKLHNMYEDAVLLESGSQIQIIDEEEDEPIVLGKDESEP